MEIKRDHYLDDLINRKHNGMIKIVTGVRRCGKSYLLFELFKKHLLAQNIDRSHIIEIALDDRKSKELRNPDVCYQYVKDAITDSDMYYVLLDEVQLMDEFEDVLNGFLHIKNVDVYVTGSNSKFLSSDIITEFRGRGDEVRIYPLSFREFYTAHDAEFSEAWNEYQAYGGLPAIALMKTEKQKADYLKKLFDNVYINDVVERNNVQNVEELNDLVNVLASSIGSPTNPTNISNTFRSEKKVTFTNKTISKYINYLEDAFLISEAARYDVKGRKYINANVKYYFVDIGLRNARLNFRQQEVTRIMENIIYNELLIRGYSVDVGIVEINTRNQEGKSIRKQLEVDFVANQGNLRYYIQSAYQMVEPEKQEQERKSLKYIGDSFKKVIIVRDDIKPWHDDNGFLIMGLKDFLLNEKCLET